jgi:hypothetical protein
MKPPTAPREAAEANAEAARLEHEATQGRLTLAAHKLRREADAELRRVKAELVGGSVPLRSGSNPKDGLAYPTLDQIEVKRLSLAAAGMAHGYDALGGKSPQHPFPGQRSTIVRRYRGLEPPGTWIPGVCDTAPPHQHPSDPATRAPGTP